MNAKIIHGGRDVDDPQHLGSALDRDTGEVIEFMRIRDFFLAITATR